MKLPKLNPIQKSVAQMEAFGGLNRRAVPQDNEFAEEVNLSSDKYPALGLRERRWYNESLAYTTIGTATQSDPASTPESRAKALVPNVGDISIFRVRQDNATATSATICGETFLPWEYGWIINLGINNYEAGALTTDTFTGVTSEAEAKALVVESPPATRTAVFRAAAGFTVEGITFSPEEHGWIKAVRDQTDIEYTVKKLSNLPSGGTNIKLHYNNELLRLIPQINADGEDVYDKMNYGGNEVTDWQTLGLSKYADLAAKGKGINDISVANIGSKVVIMPYAAWLDTVYDATAQKYYCGSLTDYYKKDETSIPTVNEDDTVSVTVVFDDGSVPSIITIGQGATTAEKYANGVEGELRYTAYGGFAKYNADGTGNLLKKRFEGYTLTDEAKDNIKHWDVIENLRLRISGANNGPLFPTSITAGNNVKIENFIVSVVDRHGDPAGTKTIAFKNDKQVIQTKIAPGYSTFDIELGDPSDKENWFVEGAAIPFAIMYNASASGTYNPANAKLSVKAITITGEAPKLDYVCGVNNRIWGCGADGHEIYASTLGNIFNWQKYDGSADDAWTATVGEGKEWTGACVYDGAVHFFKRDRIIRVTGTKPANFSYKQYSLTGCVDNASIAVVADKLFYMGADGVYVYTGGTPQRISDKIGGTWKYGVGAGFRGKYYLCRTQDNGESELLVYDTNTGNWHRESGSRWYSAFNSPDNLYFTQRVNINDVEDDVWGTFLKLRGYDYYSRIEDVLEWNAETGDFHDEPYSKKYVSRLDLSLSLAAGSTCNVYISYDNSRDWILLRTLTDAHKDTEPIRIIPKRCDRFRLRLAGKGDFTLYNVTKTVEEARDDG